MQWIRTCQCSILCHTKATNIWQHSEWVFNCCTILERERERYRIVGNLCWCKLLWNCMLALQKKFFYFRAFSTSRPHPYRSIACMTYWYHTFSKISWFLFSRHQPICEKCEILHHAKISHSTAGGRISAAAISTALSGLQRSPLHCYVCGPPPMLDTMVDILTSDQCSVDSGRIHFEKWW
jgi:hypothetical protein